MTPREVAQTLREISQLLQIKGENAFKVRAYDLGADAFDALPGDPGAPGGLYERVKKGTLTELGGVGKAISEKVADFATFNIVTRRTADGSMEIGRASCRERV